MSFLTIRLCAMRHFNDTHHHSPIVQLVLPRFRGQVCKEWLKNSHRKIQSFSHAKVYSGFLSIGPSFNWVGKGFAPSLSGATCQFFPFRW